MLRNLLDKVPVTHTRARARIFTFVFVDSSSYNKHDTPLMIAASKGIFKVVQLLLEWKANVDAKSDE